MESFFPEQPLPKEKQPGRRLPPLSGETWTLHTKPFGVSMTLSGVFLLGLALFRPRLSCKLCVPQLHSGICHKGWQFPTSQMYTRARRTQLEPLVAKQLLTLIFFSTGSRRAANSECSEKKSLLLL